MLNPKAVPLLSNARTACMLFFLQVHGRSLLGTSLPSLRLCLSATSRQGQGDASCTSSFARGLWRYSRHSIIHGSLCRSTPCLAGGPECRRTAGNKPCMLLWDLAGASQHKHQVWQKSDFMGGKQECVNATGTKGLRLQTHVMAGHGLCHAACLHWSIQLLTQLPAQQCKEQPATYTPIERFRQVHMWHL